LWNNGVVLPEKVVEMLERSPRRETRIALVGANNHTWKYGFIIFQDLRAKGFTVYPVNPNEREVCGEPAFASIADCPEVDIVNFVVPPEVTLEVLREHDPKKCDVVWFQPGSYDRRVVAEAEQRFANVIVGDCIMVVT
jgi:uncharacterized protein